MAALRTVVALAAAALAAIALAQAGQKSPSPTGYWPSQTCATCHPQVVEQHMQSHHESSFRNPVFQAQYFEQVLPRASREPALVEEARTCTACHAPVAFAWQRRQITGPMPNDPSLSGVTCDLCHTITGHDGPTPRNGNFVSAPSDRKLGPFVSEGTWHHVYAEYQTRSELCGTCHEAVNHHGLTVKGTYTEWKRSEFARRGVQCQDCHMTPEGFLVDEHSRFAKGAAAQGALLDAPTRDRLYTHRFPGAHSRSQVEGAIALTFSHTPGTVRPDATASFSLTVDNHRSGHKMPTGSVDLRLMWIEVTASAGGRSWQVPATVKARGGYGVAFARARDAQLIGSDVPERSRVYRAVFFDSSGEQTLASYDAIRSVWDNRLEAGERRVEPYQLSVPAAARGTVKLEARLLYLSYPSAFARMMEVAPATPVEVARATAELPVIDEPAPPAVPRGGPPVGRRAPPTTEERGAPPRAAAPSAAPRT